MMTTTPTFSEIAYADGFEAARQYETLASALEAYYAAHAASRVNTYWFTEGWLDARGV